MAPDEKARPLPRYRRCRLFRCRLCFTVQALYQEEYHANQGDSCPACKQPAPLDIIADRAAGGE